MALHNTAKDAVASKTTPNLQAETRVDNSKTFEHDYLVQVDNADNVPQHVKDQQLVNVREHAIMRGLRPTGEVTLHKEIKEDARNVRLIYRVPVVLADMDENRYAVEHAPATDTNADDDLAAKTDAPPAPAPTPVEAKARKEADK